MPQIVSCEVYMLKVVLLLNFKQKFKGGEMEGEREIELDVELLWEFSHLKFLSDFRILSPQQWLQNQGDHV